MTPDKFQTFIQFIIMTIAVGGWVGMVAYLIRIYL